MSATGAISGNGIVGGVWLCNRVDDCDVSARFFHVCPVRSSMNSRQLAGRAALAAVSCHGHLSAPASSSWCSRNNRRARLQR